MGLTMTSAARTSSRMRDRSPKNAPASSVLTTCPSLRMLTWPSLMTKNSSPLSPCDGRGVSLSAGGESLGEHVPSMTPGTWWAVCCSVLSADLFDDGMVGSE